MIDVTMSGMKKKAYHHGDLRQALLDEALKMVAEGALESLSLRAVARRVGVSVAAPYHHFPNKGELLAAVAADGFRRMNAAMEESVVDGTPSERMASMGRAYVRFAVEHPAHYRVMFRPALRAGRSPDDGDALEAEGGRCFQGLLDASAACLGPQASPDEVRAMAVTAWSTVHGLASLWNDGALPDRFPGAGLEELSGIVTDQLSRLTTPSG